ncbi:hypothetical protein BEWA_019460 [Theileria equi strain WA]|uniref:NF-kappa-B-activating protein C-terminal domain-containing protein n=1 Tax=Theileria equi strain WA TaxID=1537102 RepID=L0AVP7_THEEQ|nr:hypothetical protein BEWA_019460 [Theileria equi strain WA]AFZ79101.1 hypothetical protein BEWA_019460 [Theileria equi strain WA]|eukprot:XP_004828767.1 hypothetical protein BEWA_019460 [Theileria equi strain WA]
MRSMLNGDRSEWLDKRMESRMRKKLKCDDVYAKSRSSSPDVYKDILKRRCRPKPESRSGDSPLKAGEGDASEDATNEDSRAESDDKEYGPQPLKIVQSLNKRIKYSNELLPGEGAAIAQYVQEGKRIPRRGEVGITSEQIEQFEKIGYVMSGSRHKAINAMRIKKESLVLTAEQERARIIENYEKTINQENELINNLKEMIRKKRQAKEDNL